MEYEKVSDELTEIFPDFVYMDISEGLQHCIAGEFAFYLLEAYKNNNIPILTKAGNFIENLYSYNDEKMENLATLGYLEGIQNVWSNRKVNPDGMLEYLGEKSKDGWVYLNRSWNGCDTCTQWFSKL